MIPNHRFITELRVAWRGLARDRWFAGAGVLILGLGTGLNTAVFAVAYGTLVRPLPYGDSSRIALLRVAVPLADVASWREHLPSLGSVAAFSDEKLTVRGFDEPRFVSAAVVDDDFFATLKCQALAGRPVERSDAEAVVVISERLARQTRIPRQSLLGRAITVGQVPATVIGIMPAVFAFPSQETVAWVSARSLPAIAFDRSRDERRFRLVGRLRPGLTFTHVEHDAREALKRLSPSAATDPAAGPLVSSLHESILRPVLPVLRVFQVSALIVFLIASANVATILVSRTIARRGEFAVRTAIGANRFHLVQTLVAESLLVAIGGAVVGVLLASVAVRAIGSWGAAILPRLGDVRMDWPAYAFTIGLVVLAVLTTALPAARVIGSVEGGLRDKPHRQRAGVGVRRALAIIQIASAALLLSVGALLSHTILRLLNAEIGVEPRNALVSELKLTDSVGFDALEKREIERLLERARAIPGTVAVGVGSSLPPDRSPLVVTARFTDGGLARQTSELAFVAVTPGYLEALGVRLVNGRYFEPSDDRVERPVVVLSRLAAHELMPDGRVLNAQLPIELPGMRGRGRSTVIGTVADAKYFGLESVVTPAVYVLWKDLPATNLFLVLRTKNQALDAVPLLRAALRDANSAMPIMPIQPLEDVIVQSVADRRLRALLGTATALLAWAIALGGVASGLARLVSERRHELGVRAAIGASPADQVWHVMREGAMVTTCGTVLGIFAALACGRLLQSIVFGVRPQDPAVLGTVALFIGASALLVCYLPARSAAAIDPVEVLREN